MPRRLVRRDILWLSAIVGLFLLLAVQVPFGARGFGPSSASPFLRILEMPGRLLGWGGVALLVVGLAYALVTWMRGQTPGRVLAILGTLVFAIGIGAFAGALASTPERGGGVVAGSLAAMMKEAVGALPAAIVLAVIAIPGLLLALAPLLLDMPNRPIGGGVAGATTDMHAKPRYPERRIGPDGLEIPMQLGGTDVGPIRYREPGDDPQAPPPTAPRVPVDASLPKSDQERRSKRITGVRFQDEGPEAPAPLTEEPTRDVRLAPGVRYVDIEQPAPPPPLADEPEPPPPPPVAAEPAPPSAPPRKAKGKRGNASEPGASAAAPASVSASARAAPGAPAARAAPETPADAAAPTYRGKLAATGIFEAGAPAAARGAKPPTPKPRPATSRSIDDALKSLFSSLPLDELPPPRTPEEPAPPESVVAPDDPNQTSLPFTPRTEKEKDKEKQKEKEREKAKASPVPAARTDSRKNAAAPTKPEPKVAPKPGPKTAPKLEPKAATKPAPKAAPKPAAAPVAEGKPAPPPRGKSKASPAKHPATSDALFPAAVEAAIERGSASLVLLKRKLNVGYERAEGLMEALVAEGIVGEMTASGSRPTLLTGKAWKSQQAG